MRRALAAFLILASLWPASVSAREVEEQTLGGFQFRCEMDIGGWPSVTGFSAVCGGDATGAGLVGGTPVDCSLGCSFDARLSGSDSCAAMSGDIAPLGNYEGEIYIDGVLMGHFYWLRVGTELVFFPVDGSLGGRGSFIPSLPIGVCGPGGSIPTTVLIAGQMAAAAP